jgi:predicted nucleic acid-binding protein
MTRPCTLDASVFLNAFNSAKEGHADSHRLLNLLQSQAIPLIVPTLVLPEVAATISRVRGNASLARTFAYQLSRLPNLPLGCRYQEKLHFRCVMVHLCKWNSYIR